MRTGNEELQEVLETIDMEAWLDAEGIRYRSQRGARGLQLNVKTCPCCGNDKYKVYLNAETGLGNCFAGSCEEKFNKWKFISAALGTSARDVIEHVKAFARDQGWRPARTKAVAVNTAAELLLPESIALPHKGRNLKYLDNRGINGTMAAYFGLRFCQSGQFRSRDEYGRWIAQDYSKRIIIPIYDFAGELVSFQGRDITGEAEKKYLFPPGFASTGSVLYNGQNALGAEKIVIGEGVFDVAATKIALDEDMNLRDVVPVGSFGKHLSSGDEASQLARVLELREKGLKQVTIMWDGEERAIQDAIAAGLMLHKCGIVTRIAILPKDKDPNEVPAAVVRAAYYRAEVVNPMIAARLRLARRVA